jgi:hypothetical protein
MHFRRSALLAAATTLAGAAIIAPPASATIKLPQTISPVGQSASYPTVTADDAGDFAVSWNAYTSGLMVSLHSAGGTWDDTPSQLNTPGTQISGRQVVLDHAGNATAVWSEYTMSSGSGGFPGMPMPGPAAVMTAHRTAGGTWSTPEQLSTSGVNAGYMASLAVGDDNQVIALWTEGSTLRSSSRTSTGSWSTAATIPSSATSQTAGVAIDADGVATAIWQGSGNHVQASTLAPGGSWSAPQDISGANGYAPSLAMNDEGDATVVWNNGSYAIYATRRTTTAGSWGTPTKVSVDGGLNYYTPKVAVDDAGRATVVWSQADPAGQYATYHQMAASRAENGTWSSPYTMGVGGSDGPSVATSADGHVTAVWAAYVSNTSLGQSVSHAPGAPWGATVDHPDLSYGYPSVGVDGQGNSLIAAAPTSRVITVADDIAGPHLNGLSIPASAAVGSSVAFSVSPLDVWSDTDTTSWDFGDGATANGTSPSHTYSTTGEKTVTVTSTDILGHETTRSSTVNVTEAGATPITNEPAPSNGTPAANDPAPASSNDATPASTPPAAPAAPTSAAKPVDPAGTCVSQRVLTIHLNRPAAGQKVRTATLSISGQADVKLSPSARTATVDLRGRKKSTVKVTITQKLSNGRIVRDKRTFGVCGAPGI